jgi:hypothetical protein
MLTSNEQVRANPYWPLPLEPREGSTPERRSKSVAALYGQYHIPGEERPAEVLAFLEEEYNRIVKIVLALHAAGKQSKSLTAFRQQRRLRQVSKSISCLDAFRDGAEDHIFLTVCLKFQSDSLAVLGLEGSEFSLHSDCSVVLLRGRLQGPGR